MSNEVILVKEDLSKGNEIKLTEKQLNFLFAQTPQSAVRKRPAKGGGQWSYVSGTYIRKVLNLMFGWDWDFEVVESHVEYGEVTVLGRLTCRVNGSQIVKMQYGNKDIVYKKETKDPLSIGNDRKAAATDALKKCAAELGIAADVYHPDEFKQVKVSEDFTLEDVKELFEEVKRQLEAKTRSNAQRIIENEEKESYNKLAKELWKYKKAE
jgi:hypothetical protein